MPFKLSADVGTRCELRKLFVRRCRLSCDSHGRVLTRPRVLVIHRMNSKIKKLYPLEDERELFFTNRNEKSVR
jgi:hypothetical protein